jgi:general secretion pathway protein D
MTLRRRIALAAPLAALTALAGCASVPQPQIQRAPVVIQGATPADAAPIDAAPAETAAGAAMLRTGSGVLIDRSAATAPPPAVSSAGEATFNFEGESLHAVVKAILGDLLQQNYVIAPGVQGTVTLATPRPVSPTQALGLLEMVLGWNNARMVWADGRYNIVADDRAIAGQLAPRVGPASAARGYELRAVPLRFISAVEMEKLLKPYARERAVVSVDTARNLIVLAGTRAELENYLRTVEVFDVDWLAGMSVGIFPLQSAEAEKVVRQLETLFGTDGGTPLAGMFRFMPLEGINAVLVITPQPKYLRDIEEWLERIDQGGQGTRLYVYDVMHSKAVDLAQQLSSVFGGSAGGAARRTDRSQLAPGLTPRELTTIGEAQRPAAPAAPARAGGEGIALGDTADVSITAIEENNSIVVRATPSQWESIRRTIERLDVMPLQVHIEAQIVEVNLTGELAYGVSWFFGNSIAGAPVRDPAGIRAEARNSTGTKAFAGSIADGGFNWQILRPNSLAILDVLDSVTDVRVLSAPSVVVRNNVEAQLSSGTKIPVASTSFNPISGDPGTGGGTFANIQYLDTGVNLKVTPRVSRNGMVFMQIDQSVSSPSATGPTVRENVSVDDRSLVTEVAVQSGETILIAGLIRDDAAKGSAGVPGLSRIPVLGGLFGSQSQRSSRQEIIVLITPTVLSDAQDARRLTDEYGRRFRALEPLRTDGSGQR